jgi:hypothetical protein
VRFFFRHTFIILLILFFTGIKDLPASNSEPFKFQNRFREMTREDITIYKDIKSTDITVFGLYLSMKLEEIVRELNQYDFLYVEKDVFNENRLYIYDDKGNDSDNTLAYLILDENTYDLKEIILYPNMIKYLQGNSKKLVTLEMINSRSEIVQYFAGTTKERKKILDIPSLKMVSYAYFFPERNFVVTKNKIDKKIQISFSLVEGTNF